MARSPPQCSSRCTGGACTIFAVVVLPRMWAQATEHVTPAFFFFLVDSVLMGFIVAVNHVAAKSFKDSALWSVLAWWLLAIVVPMGLFSWYINSALVPLSVYARKTLKLPPLGLLDDVRHSTAAGCGGGLPGVSCARRSPPRRSRPVICIHGRRVRAEAPCIQAAPCSCRPVARAAADSEQCVRRIGRMIVQWKLRGFRGCSGCPSEWEWVAATRHCFVVVTPC